MILALTKTAGERSADLKFIESIVLLKGLCIGVYGPEFNSLRR
jgi:hypothetical protein